jgi:hypothetical protein
MDAGHNTHIYMQRTEWKRKTEKNDSRSIGWFYSMSREGMGIKRELRLWVVLPHVFSIEETPQPRDLRRQVYHDDLHLDVELQLQDLLARPERRLARRDEHVPRYTEPLQLVDHLAELGAPRKDAQLK